MPRGRIRLGTGAVALVGATVLGLAGCGADDSSGPRDPETPTSAESPTDAATEVGPPCDVVTAEDLATWTGVPRRVAGPDETSGEVECRTIGDPDDGHLVRWTFEPSSGDHEEDVAGATTSAAERQDVEVPGGGPAVVLTDESLKAVTVLSWTASDELLSVEVLDSGTGAQDLTTDHLAEVATRITAAYAASGSDAGR